jgi:hypothetical protein
LLNRRKQLGERKLPKKRLSDNAARGCKPSRQRVPPARWLKHELVKRDDVPNNWHGRLKKKGAGRELLKKLLDKLPLLPSKSKNDFNASEKRKAKGCKPRGKRLSAPHRKLLKKLGKLKLRKKKLRKSCGKVLDQWLRLPWKNIMQSKQRYSIQWVSSMSPLAG